MSKDGQNLVTLASFSSSPQANLVKHALEEAGIPCFLNDENITSINPFLSPIVEGIKLHVSQDNLAEAKKVLAEFDEPGEVVLEEKGDLELDEVKKETPLAPTPFKKVSRWAINTVIILPILFVVGFLSFQHFFLKPYEFDLKAFHQAESLVRKGYHSEAYRTLQELAEKEFLPAYTYLGDMSFNGLGIEASTPNAIKWYEKAVAGSPRFYAEAEKASFEKAAFALVKIYQEGLGVPANPAKVETFLKRVDEQTNSHRAQFQLFLYYKNSSIEEAMRYLEKSAEGGYSFAQFELGAFYEQGTVPFHKDYEKAAFWYFKAGLEGNRQAQRSLNRLIRLKQVKSKWKPFL